MREFLGVIADDFTGACDAAVQFKKQGLETVVLTDVEFLKSFEDVFDVVVVDTETRNLASEDAYKKVRRAVRLLRQNNVKLVYKKIDSTLRGNIGAEINAVMDELNIEAAIVAPAFPDQKRTVINGQLLVNDVPLEKTEYACDPLSPVSSSRISVLIERQAKKRVGEIPLFHVRKETDLIVEEIRSRIDAGKRIIVADAEIQSDLERIAEASLALNVLLCGSAGLASALSSQLAVQSRVLVVSGSVNNVTLNQIEMAVKKLDVKLIEPVLSGILQDEERVDEASNSLADEAEKAIVEGKDVIIRLAGSKSLISEIQDAGKELGMNKLQVADLLLSVLSRATRKIIGKHNFKRLILIGGDTSIRIMNILGAKAIRSEGEFLPGIPSGRIMGGICDGMQIVTKAGGFGDSYTLVKIMKSLKRRAKTEN
ncbi:TPA: four-carbon acid sugar kinase family protein [Candidatus Bathyarchaeota archaeon]|nr:four-carbon acid sugar kinase family protein [Candidatus Bathyarchaeota archaeon]